jgi:putative effector of murein hydrolase
MWSRDLRRAQTDSSGKRQLALGIVSTVMAVPISITLGVNDNLGALLVSWAGIVGVNVAHALQGRSER